MLNGWATFEYEGQGERTIRKGDAILQTPTIKHREIACSEDFEVLEIVSPANFATKVVEPPQSVAGGGCGSRRAPDGIRSNYAATAIKRLH